MHDFPVDQGTAAATRPEGAAPHDLQCIHNAEYAPAYEHHIRVAKKKTTPRGVRAVHCACHSIAPLTHFRSDAEPAPTQCLTTRIEKTNCACNVVLVAPQHKRYGGSRLAARRHSQNDQLNTAPEGRTTTTNNTTQYQKQCQQIPPPHCSTQPHQS